MCSQATASRISKTRKLQTVCSLSIVSYLRSYVQEGRQIRIRQRLGCFVACSSCEALPNGRKNLPVIGHANKLTKNRLDQTLLPSLGYRNPQLPSRTSISTQPSNFLPYLLQASSRDSIRKSPTSRSIHIDFKSPTMSERKVIQKYIPPDFNPSELKRVRRPKPEGPKLQTVRLMAPFSMRCLSCGEYNPKGRKYNARKETTSERYYSIPIYRFYIKCQRCSAELVFKTDPRNMVS